MAKSYMIDRDGKPYIENVSYPVGGGLDKRCSYNKDALSAFYKCKNRIDGDEYLSKSGFKAIDETTWEKGDTRIHFDGLIDGLWGYMTTEYINE